MKDSDNCRAYFDFLEQLRESGDINMFGARPYLQMEFCELAGKPDVADKVLQAWMDSYTEGEHAENL